METGHDEFANSSYEELLDEYRNGHYELCEFRIRHGIRLDNQNTFVNEPWYPSFVHLEAFVGRLGQEISRRSAERQPQISTAGEW